MQDFDSPCIPFYFSITYCRMQPIKNILVTRLRFMGDIVLTIPVLEKLREAHPEAVITYLCEQPYNQLLLYNPYIDRILSLPPQKSGFLSRFNVIKDLVCGKFDIAIDLFGNPRSALLTFLSGSSIRIGGDFLGRRHYFTHRVKDDGKAKSAIDFHMQYLKPLNIESEPGQPFLFVTPEEKNQAREYLKNKGFSEDGPLVAIQPGASWPAKRWLPERFALLADRLNAEMGMQVIFTMGPEGVEEELVTSVVEKCRFRVKTPECLGIRRLTALLSVIDVFISNDCGPMHIAPAVGTKTIGIFGPGEPEIWFPYEKNQGHRFIHKKIDCSRCHQDFCVKLDCMRAIEVDDVFNAVRVIL